MFHMRLHRFYNNKRVGDLSEITLSDPELIHQLVNVFRFKVSDKVILFDGSGFEYECEIILINKKPARLNSGGEIRLNILKRIQGRSLCSKNISLYLSLIKKNNFELAVEKCTEVGMVEIHPIISERSEKKDLNLERLNKIVKEASEQSWRMTLPEVFEIQSLEQAVTQAVSEGKECVTFHTVSEIEAGHNRPGHQNDHPALTKAGIDGSYKIAAFVGPEGGWTEKEMELFKQNNFKILSLGQNILRAETAAIVAVWSLFSNQ